MFAIDMRSLTKFIVFTFVCLLNSVLIAQSTTVQGHVYEDDTDRPVAFAKVYFMGTQTGTYTDTNGYFHLQISDKALLYDSLIISNLGFKNQTVAIQRGIEQRISVQLSSSLFMELEEVTAVAGENPAWRYMRKLIAHKEANNPENLESYTVEEYAKIRFDLNHFTDKIKKNLLLKPFDYIWDNTETTEDGVKYLPVLMTERKIEHYYRKSPQDKKDLITGEKTTGLAGPNLVEFTNDLYITPNLYDNYVTILGKSFPSPLNDNYKSNYRFYLMDSTVNETGKTYKIRFRPKHQRELAFTGEMSIDSASYAIKEITLRFDVLANVNFVRSYYITHRYAPIEGRWMLMESDVVGDFTVLENASDLTGFFGRKKALFSNYAINPSIDNIHFKGAEPIVYHPDALKREEHFWTKERDEQLSQEEEKLYEVTDRVVNDPAFKLRRDLIRTIATGYIPFRPIQVGIYSLYSWNPIEASRLKLDLRTDPQSSSPFYAEAYGAYGFRDEQFKYKAAFQLEIPPHRTTRIGAKYNYDIEELGRSFNQIAIDHFISSFVHLGNMNARNYVRSFEGYAEQQISTGLVLRLAYFNQQFTPTLDQSYIGLQEATGLLGVYDAYTTAGLQMTFKFSHLFKDVSGTFYDRNDLYRAERKYPDVALQLEWGDKKRFASDFDYQKMKLSVRQKVNAKKWGYFQFNIEGGKTWGTVPHLLLDLPFGNPLILADEYAFNLMRFMEFASDEYITVHVSHHFNGLILDRIPLINKLKWRSFVFGKGYFGQLSEKNNQSTYLFPEGLSPIDQPYVEIGFGFENIFKIARMDFVWRLTPGVGEYYTFMVKPSFKIGF